MRAAAAVGVISASVLGGSSWGEPFSIVALPDTQNYVTNAANALLFTKQTQWVADERLLNGNTRNIVFVTHLGDLVSSGSSLTQWMRADASMDVLDGGLPQAVVPYSVLPGNHDFASTGNKSTGTENYLNFFGPDRFAGYTWYQGADPSGNNSYQIIAAGSYDILHIALEWRPASNVTNGTERSPSPLEWAQSIISANPGKPTILSTHEHLDDSPAGRSGAGDSIWNQIVRNNDQVIMILSGHHHGAGGMNDGEFHQISQNNFGNDVFEVLQDFQDYPNGGDGWLRIITFDDQANEVRFETYSPHLDQFQTETVEEVGGFASEFALPLNFVERFDFEPPAQPPVPPVELFDRIVFQEGLNGYEGTRDKEIRSSGGDANNGQNTEISVDGDDGSPGNQPNHALIRFDGFIGDGEGQISMGGVIERAVLRLNVTNPGSGFTVYRMTTTWDESTTWQDLGGDGITPGTETAADAIMTIGANNSSSNVSEGFLELDVTEAVNAWLSGGAN
ncbi:MAG: metallophosphoesterase, partial [Planctomycetota bacterium]